MHILIFKYLICPNTSYWQLFKVEILLNMHFAITVQSRLSRGRVRVNLLLICVLQVNVLENVLVNNPMTDRLFWFHVACFSRCASSLRVSDFPFYNDFSRAMEIFHWLFLPMSRGL